VLYRFVGQKRDQQRLYFFIFFWSYLQTKFGKIWGILLALAGPLYWSASSV